MGDDGYPQRIWDKRTGEIDREVAEYWRRTTTCATSWSATGPRSGPNLEGKIHIYAGDMDNYYLNNATYLMEEFLESTTDPYYAGLVDYGDRFEHCWNGDHENSNAISRMRYNTMYLPRILERIRDADCPGGCGPDELEVLMNRLIVGSLALLMALLSVVTWAGQASATPTDSSADTVRVLVVYHTDDRPHPRRWRRPLRRVPGSWRAPR